MTRPWKPWSCRKGDEVEQLVQTRVECWSRYQGVLMDLPIGATPCGVEQQCDTVAVWLQYVRRVA